MTERAKASLRPRGQRRSKKKKAAAGEKGREAKKKGTDDAQATVVKGKGKAHIELQRLKKG